MADEEPINPDDPIWYCKLIIGGTGATAAIAYAAYAYFASTTT